MRMSSREYYEELWLRLAQGLEPADFAVRSRFLADHVRAGERVLDVGCAEGRFTAELARAGADVIGIDVAEEPLRRARAQHPELDVRLVSDAGPWDLDDASFDVVWAGEVLEHVLDTAAWLSEIRRVLRSGGSLLVSTPAHEPLTLVRLALSKRAFAAHFDPRGDHLRFYSRDMLSQLLGEFGFQEIRVRSWGGPPLARRRLLAHATRARF